MLICLCGKVFGQCNSFIAHLKEHEQRGEVALPLFCNQPDCNFEEPFSTFSSFDTHLRENHSQSQPSVQRVSEREYKLEDGHISEETQEHSEEAHGLSEEAREIIVMVKQNKQTAEIPDQLSGQTIQWRMRVIRNLGTLLRNKA